MRIGITGGIAAGKSTVTAELAKKLPHYRVASIDDIVKGIYEEIERLDADISPESAELRQKVVKTFGTCLKQGVTELIVRDPSLLDAVEEMFSPAITAKLGKLLEESDIIIEFPLLFEKGYWKHFDFIVNVEATEATRRERAMARPGMTESKLALILSRQRKDWERSSGSHYTFVNDSMETLKFHTDVISIRALTFNCKKIGIVSGSFDPITNGHLHLVHEGLRLLDFIVVAVANNRGKKGMFDLDKRLELVSRGVHEYLVDHAPGDWEDYLHRVRMVVIPSDETLVNVADMLGAPYIIRGLRNSTDFEYERQIDLVQKRISPWTETLYLMTPRELTEVSSSMVKSVHGLNGWEEIAKPYVPECVLDAMKEKVA